MSYLLETSVIDSRSEKSEERDEYFVISTGLGIVVGLEGMWSGLQALPPMIGVDLLWNTVRGLTHKGEEETYSEDLLEGSDGRGRYL